MMQRFTYLIALLLIISSGNKNIFAQSPKQEMRAVWLTTVWGLDWPKTKIPESGGEIYINQQKQQLINLLDSLEKAGINAVFFQVRTEADAFYPSSYEPWSEHLVAERGIDPGYDPLQFALEESHKRGLELHAWLNPYRFESVAGKYSGTEGDYSQTNPEWVLSYSGGGSILDPGNPEVRKLITDIVEEIVVNYDLDGIVFDDYFYAYGGTPASLDKFSQDSWKPESMNLHDWRRDNINRMIADVYATIKENKSWVRFGVSPFGIWTTDAQVAASYGLTLPQGITGLDAYNSIYADAVAWLKEGTVDYISPQIYWPTTSTGQDYKKLAPWWSDVANRYGRHLYVSHTLADLDESDYPPPVALKSAYSNFLRTELRGMSMMEYFSQLGSKKSVAGFDPSEYGQQIFWNRISDKNQAPGSVFFRASMFLTEGFMNYLLANEYEDNALPPPMPWAAKGTGFLPQRIQLEKNKLIWETDEENVKYAVYAVPELLIDQPGVFNNASFLLGMTYTPEFNLQQYSYTTEGHVFAVSVVDRNGNEFPPAIMGMDIIDNIPSALLSPEDKSNVHPGFNFVWEPVDGANYYLLEVASDTMFNSVIDRRNITETTFGSDVLNLEEESLYYWRINTRMANATDTASAVRRFSIKPLPRPVLEYPTNELTDVDVTPVITWEPFDEGFNFRIQISSGSSFSEIQFDQEEIEGTSLELPPGVIFPYSTYYLRIQAVDGDSVTLWSDIIKFSTVNTPPSVPVIISPINDETVDGQEVSIVVQEDHRAKSFTFQLSGSATFPWNDRQQTTIQAPENSLLLTDPEEGTWYVKARANYGATSYTDWSETVTFSILSTSSTIAGVTEFSLEQPVFNSPESMEIRYSLEHPSRVQLYITSLTGKRMAVLSHQNKGPGKHTYTYSAGSLLPGVYLLTLDTDYGRRTVKLIKSW